MRTPIISRLLLVLGFATVLVGAILRREWRVENDMQTLGVVAVMAVGFFAVIVGLYLMLREETPANVHQARRKAFFDRTGWQAAIPPVVAGGMMLGYFTLTNRWTELGNPVASQLAVIAGVIGAFIGILADRITRWFRFIVPVALLVSLIAWGDRLPIESETTSRGEMVTLLSIVILIAAIAINLPQILRGRRQTTADPS